MIKFSHFHFGVSLEQILFSFQIFRKGSWGYALPPDKRSRDSMYDGLKKIENLSEIFNFHTILLHFALLDINNLFTTLD